MQSADIKIGVTTANSRSFDIPQRLGQYYAWLAYSRTLGPGLMQDAGTRCFAGVRQQWLEEVGYRFEAVRISAGILPDGREMDDCYFESISRSKDSP